MGISSKRTARRPMRLLGLLGLLGAAALLAAFAALGATKKPSVVKTLGVDDFPAFAAANPNTNRIYVTNLGGTDGSSFAGLPDNVSVIDGATDTEITRITVGDHPSGVGVNYATNRVYVANTTKGTISVIDGATNTVAETINLPNLPVAGPDAILPPEGCPVANAPDFGVIPRRLCPGGIAVDQETGLVYVGAAKELPVAGNVLDKPGFLAVLNDATNTWTLVPAGISPIQPAVNSVTDRAYVTSFDSDIVTVVTTNPCCAKVTDIAVENQPYGMDLNPVTNLIYVGHVENRTLEIIDGATNAIIKTLTLGDPDDCPPALGQLNCATRNVAVNAKTNRIYVNGLFDNLTWVIHGGPNRLIHEVEVGEGPRGIAVNRKTGKVYVGNTAESSGGVVSPQPDGLEDTVSVILDQHGEWTPDG